MKITMLFRNSSIKTKLWLGTGVIGVFFIITMLSILSRQYEIKKANQVVIAQYQPILQSLLNINTRFKEATTNLGLYLVSRNSSLFNKYRKNLSSINPELNKLMANPNLDKAQFEFITKIQSDIINLSKPVELLINLKNQTAENIPAIALAKKETKPLGKKISNQFKLISGQFENTKLILETIDIKTSTSSAKHITAAKPDMPQNLNLNISNAGILNKQTEQIIILDKQILRIETRIEKKIDKKSLSFKTLRISKKKIFKAVSAQEKKLLAAYNHLLNLQTKLIKKREKLVKIYHRALHLLNKKIVLYQQSTSLRKLLIRNYQKNLSIYQSAVSKLTTALETYEKVYADYQALFTAQIHQIKKLELINAASVPRKKYQTLIVDYKLKVKSLRQFKQISELILSWESVRNNFNSFLGSRNLADKSLATTSLTNFKNKLNVIQSQASNYKNSQSNSLKNINALLAKYETSINNVFTSYLAKSWRKDIAIVNMALGPKIESINKKLESFLHIQKSLIETENIKASHLINDSIRHMIGFTLIAVIIGLFIIPLSLSIIFKPIANTMRTMTRIADDGDIYINLPDEHNDELSKVGKAFNAFVAKIRNVINLIFSASEDLLEKSTALSKITQQDQIRVIEQEEKIQSVALSFTSLFSALSEIHTKATDAVDCTDEAKTNAAQGQEIVSRTVSAIQQLASQVESSTESVKKLAEESQNIGEIIQVIRTITEQTNLLALNAAIEAARAGEQGRGFAVVADEVRALSSRVNEQTDTIQERIQSLQNEVNTTVTRMHESCEQAQMSTQLALDTGAAIKSITNSINDFTDINIHVATSTETEIVKASDINKNLEEIAGIANDATLSAHNASARGNEFSALAEQLNDLVSNSFSKKSSKS